MSSYSHLWDTRHLSHALTVLQHRADEGAPQAFHIPLTDRGCKCTQVQNGTKSFLWLPQKKKFSREATDQQAPAGPHLECAAALYRFSLFYCLNAQLMGGTGLTLQGAVFRCVSQCSERWWEMQGRTGRKYEPETSCCHYNLQLEPQCKDSSRQSMFLH